MVHEGHVPIGARWTCPRLPDSLDVAGSLIGAGEYALKWSWRIGQAFGIGIFIHATFPLVLIWAAYLFYTLNGSVFDALMGVVLVLCVFGTVILHELGHALMARRFGVATRDIILLPIGGVARMERLPEEPWQELLIAVAGPAVNVALAVIFYAILAVSGQPIVMSLAGTFDGSFLNTMLLVNISLVLFNALPAFPMDGGRVLRALLAMRMNYSRATQIAAAVGKAFAVFFGIMGLFVLQNPQLAIIAVFIWMGAEGEASMARVRHDLGDVGSESVIIRDAVALSPDDPLEKGIDCVLAGFQQDFPVIEHGTLVGLLTREDLLKALHTQGKSGKVREAMRTAFPTAAPDEPINEVVAKLQTTGLRAIPVLAEGAFVGLITTENIAEYLMVQAALKGRRS